MCSRSSPPPWVGAELARGRAVSLGGNGWSSERSEARRESAHPSPLRFGSETHRTAALSRGTDGNKEQRDWLSVRFPCFMAVGLPQRALGASTPNQLPQRRRKGVDTSSRQFASGKVARTRFRVRTSMFAPVRFGGKLETLDANCWRFSRAARTTIPDASEALKQESFFLNFFTSPCAPTKRIFSLIYCHF